MNPWLLTYDGSDPAQEGLREALTTLGNGHFVTRGAVPESRADEVHHPGTYVAGCYDRPLARGADRPVDLSPSPGSPGADRPVDGGALVNVPNWLPLTFRADGGDWFAPGSDEILSQRHTLDMRRGVLTRSLRVCDPLGRITRMEQHRLVSMDDPHLAALSMTIVPENWDGTLEVRSALDGRVTGPGGSPHRGPAALPPVPICGHAAHGVIELLTRTATSHVEIALAARTTPAGGRCRTGVEEGWVSDDRAVEARAGDEVTVEKIVALYTSGDRAVAESEAAARTAVVRAGSFGALLRRHVRAWDRLWQISHVADEDPEVQQILNLYVFHLLQTGSPRVAGPHGEARGGHAFRDDLSIFPLLVEAAGTLVPTFDAAGGLAFRI
ncbi:hypothetical protein [Streptosporangium minutum]|uniref:Glycoside hydrolase family 65 N-terminal domain-containing protein n=1 Tax=Streptosporangium minutum TaxID=569862 RepID=A0A243RLU3_9ACTN|nr:hypothetical protein [Streptosporangium minutum]OUC95778.1 hypothetical protein CA984_17530 [Streptosporangium minutum]